MKRFTERIGVAFEPEMADKIKALKDRFGLKFGEVVRECVEHELQRLIQRHTKAQKTRTRTIQIPIEPCSRLALGHAADDGQNRGHPGMLTPVPNP